MNEWMNNHTQGIEYHNSRKSSTYRPTARNQIMEIPSIEKRHNHRWWNRAFTCRPKRRCIHTESVTGQSGDIPAATGVGTDERMKASTNATIRRRRSHLTNWIVRRQSNRVVRSVQYTVWPQSDQLRRILWTVVTRSSLFYGIRSTLKAFWNTPR